MVSSLGKLVNVSIKVPEETKKLMKKVNVNWSEYLREVIESKIKMEVAKDAAKKLDEIRQRIKGASIEEIIRWIREDRERNLE
jgi:predicted DNA-binding protein